MDIRIHAAEISQPTLENWFVRRQEAKELQQRLENSHNLKAEGTALGFHDHDFNKRMGMCVYYIYIF